jgi:hypothetical protein
MDNSIEIIVNNEKKTINLYKFAAMDGWDLQRRFVEFIESKDKFERRQFTSDVLAYAKVQLKSTELPLTTDALIDNHLQTWENLKIVFESVLGYNGIDPKKHAELDIRKYWSLAGEEMATSFLAEIQTLMGPILEYSKNAKD